MPIARLLTIPRWFLLSEDTCFICWFWCICGRLIANRTEERSSRNPRIEGSVALNGMSPNNLDNFTERLKPIGGRRGWTKIDTGQRYDKPAASGPKFTIG